jgi:hypothetical protein
MGESSAAALTLSEEPSLVDRLLRDGASLLQSSASPAHGRHDGPDGRSNNGSTDGRDSGRSGGAGGGGKSDSGALTLNSAVAPLPSVERIPLSLLVSSPQVR